MVTKTINAQRCIRTLYVYLLIRYHTYSAQRILKLHKPFYRPLHNQLINNNVILCLHLPQGKKKKRHLNFPYAVGVTQKPPLCVHVLNSNYYQG
jgi:hypothetical protein